MPIVRALDVGFGATKFVLNHVRGLPMECAKFPSLAPQAAKAELGGSYLRRRNTVVIDVNGRRYEVGTDIDSALGTYYTRAVDPDYTDSAEYLALARGALDYMGAEKIDLLVVGLPVSNLPHKRERLEARLTGIHPISRGTVHVRRVITLAQPLGGFIAYMVENRQMQWAEGHVNLIIDPGYFTFDWVVANGLTPNDTRSGSANGGVAAIIRHIAEAVSAQLGKVYDNPLGIERALETGQPLTVFGRQLPLSRFVNANSLHPAEEAVAAMISRMGVGTDIENIVLVGGGANMYLPYIERRFPDHRIHVVDRPDFANVRGFQYAGEEATSMELVA